MVSSSVAAEAQQEAIRSSLCSFPDCSNAANETAGDDVTITDGTINDCSVISVDVAIWTVSSVDEKGYDCLGDAENHRVVRIPQRLYTCSVTLDWMDCQIVKVCEEQWQEDAGDTPQDRGTPEAAGQ